MRIQILLIFLTISVFAGEKWSTPMKLEPITNTSIGLNLFTASTGSSYILYSRLEITNRTQQLGIKIFDFPNKSLGDFKELSRNRLYFAGSIKGSADGNELLVAEGASRMKFDEVPEKNSSFYDIFLLRSSDAGLNWSDEIAIDKDSKDDSISRLYPMIVAVEELSQMFMFYMNYYENRSETISCAKYDPNIADLTAEEATVIKGYVSSFSAGYTYMNNSLLLHVAFVNDQHKIMYISSADGKTWQEPIQIGEATNSTESSPLVVLASNTKSYPGEIFLAYIGSDNMAYLMMSNDTGKNWSAPIKVGKKIVDSLSLVVCGDETDQKAFIMTSNEGRIKMFEYDVEDHEIDSMKSPFKRMGMMRQHMQCIKKLQNYELIALATDYRDLVSYITTISIED